MAKKAAGKDNGSATPGDIRDLIPSLTLHPGENPEHYAALEKALITEFTPASAMEMSLVKRLIANEWESHRSDKLRADITRACLRKAALKTLMDGTMRVLAGPEERNLADALVSDDSEVRQVSRETLAKTGFSLPELQAQAYLQSFREFEALERRPDVFDRRRRDLIEDLRALQRRRSQAAVEDAELVDADGD